ncbi:unnamed protein product [Sphagnum jensenii]|uniref:Uncharacterized protein n=1 Tax=Sphagnum jensenii TaxID=128206 RepID=A0ABP0X8S4_9BRYO
MDSRHRGDGAKEMWFGETTFPGEKVGLGRSFSLRIDSGRGGDGVKERENVSLRRRWAGEKMCRARKRMWPGGKDGPKDDAQGGNGAGKKMVPEDDLVLRRG